MAETVDIPIVDLLVDTRNARLKDEQPSQQAAILAIAKLMGRRLLALAGDLVENGNDPTSLLAVIATGDQRKRYTVLEGNRRVVALKALETPSLVAGAFDSSALRKLHVLSQRFAKKPISTLKAVLFESELEANHWITLRHTGQNDGVGLVEWGADEKDRYNARHGKRSPAGQVLDFVEKVGKLSERAQTSSRGVITSLTRLLNTPAVRERLGIEILDGEVISWFPPGEVAKGLTKIVEDLKSGDTKVGQIYHEADRLKYLSKLPTSAIPRSSERLKNPTPLSGDGSPDLGHRKPRGPRKGRRRPQERTTLIPKTCSLNIASPKINALYIELTTLTVVQYPNACSVALRVFLELSLDSYIEQHKVHGVSDNDPLAKKMKVVASALKNKGMISDPLHEAVGKMANSQTRAYSTMTFNQYVHNRYVFPTPADMRVAWDEIQPFVEKLWP